MFKPTAVVIGAFVEELKRLPAGVPASGILRANRISRSTRAVLATRNPLIVRFRNSPASYQQS